MNAAVWGCLVFLGVHIGWITFKVIEGDVGAALLGLAGMPLIVGGLAFSADEPK